MTGMGTVAHHQVNIAVTTGRSRVAAHAQLIKPAEHEVTGNEETIDSIGSVEKDDGTDRVNSQQVPGLLPADSGKRESPSTAKNATEEIKKNISVPDSVPPLAKNSLGKSKKRIEWGINLNAGLSGFSKGLSGLFASSYSNMAYSIPPGGVPPGSNINNNFAAFTQPSDIKKGFSFAAGVFVSRPIGKTWRLQSGLNYTYSSTRIQLGTKIYNPSGTAQYSNGGYQRSVQFLICSIKNDWLGY
ncbi:MAG: hypothetical protein ABI813_05355 [Bacteroidota bacterium]